MQNKQTSGSEVGVDVDSAAQLVFNYCMSLHVSCCCCCYFYAKLTRRHELKPKLMPRSRSRQRRRC